MQILSILVSWNGKRLIDCIKLSESFILTTVSQTPQNSNVGLMWQKQQRMLTPKT